MSSFTAFASFLVIMSGFAAPVTAAPVKPSDLIIPDNAGLVSDLVSPGNFVFAKQGIRMSIVPSERLEWPPYKTATEKYASQVKLNDRGELDPSKNGAAR